MKDIFQAISVGNSGTPLITLFLRNHEPNYVFEASLRYL